MRECKLPLRTVLQNFINNVESLESLNSNTEEVYEQEFQELKKLTESLKTHPDYVCTEGEKECNRRKNRYKDILPYDRTRVVLQAFPSVPGSDYINANYIRGASGSRAYIASQGPLPHTVPDFWRMVVECEVQVIIMASNETEGGKHKCECYWVENDGEERQFGNVLVSFIKSRQVCPDFLVRTLKIKFTTENDKTEERTICQFHYMLWPDHGVPDTVRPLLHMVRLVRDCQASETLPVLVHCSAGCGRTGTICAIDYVWGLLRTGKLTDNLCLLDLVREMRVQRVAMVQTKEQYTLLHQAVKELFRERLSLIDSHPYENVATDGNPLSMQSEDKESDYEELFSQEKQDFSSKPVHASAAGMMGSLSKVNPNANNHKLHHGKDNLRRSASTSSLETSKIAPVTKKESTMQASLTSSLDASLLQRDHQKRLPTFQSESMLHYKSSAKGFEDSSSSRRPPRGYSKTEKEAENFAQKMEAKEREKRKVSAPQSHCYYTKSKSNVSTPSHSPSGTANPAFTPTSPLPSPLVLTPPMPPPRSRTPSPIVSMRKSGEMGSKKMHPSPKGKESSNEKRKSDELARHTSIQKLRELFEKSPMVIECPNGTRLSRSASSVTTRPTLSLHTDATASLKSKRKISLGSEQFHGQGSKSKDTSDHTKFQICPPPPFISTSGGVEGKDLQPSPMMVTKPPSSPVFSGIGVKRKVTQSISTDAKEEKASALLSRLNDRPALPIKKSKSFRWSRSQGGSHPSATSCTSPELARKKSDLNTYFSLDREKENYSKSPKGEGSIKKIANDFFPLHQDGLKLSVYDVSNSSGKDVRSNTSDDTGDGSLIALKPQIPPKKSIGVKFNKKSKVFPLDIPHSQSTVQIHEHDASSALSRISTNSKESQTPLSAPPNSSSFENKDFWDKMQLACFENLYDELPSRTLKYEPPVKKDSSTEIPSTSQGSKDYVNARVLSSYLKSEGSPKVSYVPLPSKREFKDKGVAHDYENCSVFSHPDLKSSKTGSGNPLYEDTVAGKNKPFREEASHQGASNSSDYEPVDFGETLTSVDEVFETLNHELIDNKYENKNNRRHMASASQDYYLNKDLDSLAIQVYKDCQAYLLHGNSQSPVPSLIVKTPSKEEQSLSSSAKIPITVPTAGAEGPVADLDEVRSKVSVPPQGLRNRERRNSYRQAVSTVSPSYGKERPLGHLKKVHKYEKIWFETMKEETDEEFSQRDNRESAGQDLSSNFNHPMNISGKEAMFKDKLEELHGLVSNTDRKTLPDLSEEELSSRDSGSTSSLFSRSAQSSRSSERIEPTYVNAVVGPSGISIPSSGASSKHQYPLIKGTSPYGTLATTTSYPYKPKMVLKENSCGSNGIPNTYATSAAATLPVRSTQSSSPQNIPPPMGFGNSTTTSTGAEKSSSDKRSRFPPIFKEPKDGSNSSEERVRRDHRSHAKFPTVSKAKPHSGKEPRHSAERGLLSPMAPPRGKRNSSPVGDCPPLIPDKKNPTSHVFVCWLTPAATRISAPAPVEKSKERSNSAPERENGTKAQSAHSGSSIPSSSLEAVHPQIVNPSLNPSIYYHSPSEPKSFPVPFGLTNFNGVSRNNSKGSGGFLPADPSSTDTEEEAAAPSKSSSNPLLRRLKATTSVKGSTKGALVAKESSALPKEEKDRGKRGAISPPGSPRSFSKALGKLKLGSKSVAANFKSYLSSRGAPEPTVDAFSDPASRHYPLQKSVSSGPSVSLFTQVVEDSKLPSPEPKKTNRELPQNFRCYDQHNNAEPKASRARQQYL